MVWGLFPVDPIPGEESYYFFSKGTYKVGRKGCDVIVNKDKGVSRVHAEIVIDEMISKDDAKKKSSGIRIRDCSKYGTFIKKPVGSKEKVQELPTKETTLDDADLVSFGTGNATYRFNYVSLVFFICGLEPGQSNELKEKISSIGASMTDKWSPKCTHVLVDDSNASLSADIVDAVMSQRHFVSYKWIELLADKRIGTGIPNCNSYAPTLRLQGGVSTKVAEPESRENCLSGYTFLLESSNKYKVKKKLQSLLEAFGAKVIPVGDFIQHSQDDENNRCVHVFSEDDSVCSHDLTSLSKVSEINLISAILSGHLDAAVFVSPPVVVTSTCSTDETVVADSEPEVEITSVYTSGIRKIESVEDEKGVISVRSVESVNEMEVDTTKLNVDENTISADTSANSKDGQKDDGMLTREPKIDVDDEGGEIGTSDIIFSQDLVIRNANSQPSSRTNNQVFNFKRFKKMAPESGNGFYNLVLFSKHPYKGSEYENEGVKESLKEERKRKQREAVAEDLFNNAKAKKRGSAGFISGLFKGT